MSLPHNISLGDENFQNLENFGSDPDFLYFSTLKESVGICERSIQNEVKELNLATPLESFGDTVDFSESVLEKLRDQGVKQTDKNVHTFTRSLKSQICEYHLRNSAYINLALKNKAKHPFAMTEDFWGEIQRIKECALDQWNSTKLRGNNPQKWPIGLNEFLKDLMKQPLLAQFNEPEFIFNELAEKVRSVIAERVNLLKSESCEAYIRQQSIEVISESICALFLVCFSRGSFMALMQLLDTVEEIAPSLNQVELDLCLLRLNVIAQPCFESVEKKMKDTTKLHYMRNLCDQGGFSMSTLHQYSKQNFSTTSIATDGIYLYVYVSSVEGGIFKVGTGVGDTIPGKVYEKAVGHKIEEISWVCIQGKLYLRSASKEMLGLLEVFSCETLEHTETIQLKNEDIFDNTQHQQLNKTFPILTDGTYLYLIGKKIISLPSAPIRDVKKAIVPPQDTLKAAGVKEVPQQAVVQTLAQSPQQQLTEEAQKNAPAKRIPKPKSTKVPVPGSTAASAEEPVIQGQRIIEYTLYKYDLTIPYVEPKKIFKEKKQEPEVLSIEEAQFLGIDPMFQEAIPFVTQPKSQRKIESPESQIEDANAKKETEVKENEQHQPEEEGQEEEGEIAQKKEQGEEVAQKQDEDISKQEKIAQKEEGVDQQQQKENLIEKVEEHKEDKADNADIEQLPIKDKGPSVESVDDNNNQKEEIENPEEQKPLQEVEDKLKQTNPLDQDALIPPPVNAPIKADEEDNQQKQLEPNGNEIQKQSSQKVEGEQPTAKVESPPKKESRRLTQLGVIQKTILAQAEIVQETAKVIKCAGDIVVSEYSIIFPMNVSSSLWTMNTEQVTLYSEQGIKVFSINPKDEHYIHPPTYFSTESGNNKNTEENTENSQNDLDERNINSQEEQEDFLVRSLKESWNLLSKFNDSIQLSSQENSIFQEVHDQFEKQISQLSASQASLMLEGKKLSLKKEESINQAIQEPREPREPRPARGQRYTREIKEQLNTQASIAKPIVPGNKEKRLMKTTLIAKIDAKKKLHILNPNHQACFDPINKIFYVLIWAQSNYSNVFPSIITRLYDQTQYVSSPFHEIVGQLATLNPNESKDKIQTVAQLKSNLLIKLLTLQRHRLELPWKLNKWDYTYGYALLDLTNKKQSATQQQSGGAGNDQEEKKALSRAKAKVMQRLNKQLQSQSQIQANKEMRESLDNKERAFREVQKTYAFCVEGSTEQFVYLAEKLKKAFDQFDEQQIGILLAFIGYWAEHCQILCTRDPVVSKEMQTICNIIISQIASKKDINPVILSLMKEVLAKGWVYVTKTNADQIDWIQKIIEANIETKISWVDLVMNSETINGCRTFSLDYPLRESAVESVAYPDIIDSVDQTSNIGYIFRGNRSVQLTRDSFREPLARLLFSNIEFVEKNTIFSHGFEDFYRSGFISGNAPDSIQFSVLSEQFWEKIETELLSSCRQTSSQGRTQPIWKLLKRLIEDSHSQLLKISDSKNEFKTRQALYKKFIDLFDKAIGVLETIQAPLFYEHIEHLNICLSLFFELNFAASVTAHPPGIAILKSLTDLFAKMKSLLRVGDICLAEQLFASHAEGLDQTIEKVFETNHPYERGKVIQFEQNMFPGAIAIAVNFDKRCQSDASNDFLKVAGWYDIHAKGAQQTGYSISSREGLGKVFKLSGKAVPKRQLILLANTIQVEFHSSGHAKDEKSLSRWGYKISARPIYGMTKKMWTDTESHSLEFAQVSLRFGSDNLLGEWLNTMKLCLISITQAATNLCIEQHAEKSSNSFLELAILRNGFAFGDAIERYLTKDSLNLWEIKETSNNQRSQQIQVSDGSHMSLRQDLFMKLYRGQFTAEIEEAKVEPVISQQSLILDLDWSLQCSEGNQLLQKYVENIRQKSGEFFIFSKEVTSKLRDPIQYTHEKIRPTFKQEFKELWQQCESLLVLACLHHSGLIQAGLTQCKEYILDHAQGLQETRNSVILMMLNIVQQEKEFQHTIDSLIEAQAEFDQAKEEKAKESEALKQKQLKEDQEQKEISQNKEGTQQQSVKQTSAPVIQQQFVRHGKKLKIIRTGEGQTKTSKKVVKQQQQQQQPSAAVVAEQKDKIEKQIENLIENNDKFEIDLSSEEIKEDYESDEELENNEKKRLARSASRRALHSESNQRRLSSGDTLDPELEAFLWEKFQKRFGGGNNDALKQICDSRGIEYDEDNILATTKKIFSICKAALRRHHSGTEQKSDVSSPYEIVGVRIAQKCLLLLSLSDRQSITENDDTLPDLAQRGIIRGDSTFSETDIKPVGVNRSISQPLNEKLIDKERLRSFRAWVDSYQKWKHCRETSEHSESVVEEKNELYSAQRYDPLKSIAFFLCSRVSTKEVLGALEKHDSRCARRVASFSLINSLYPLVAGTCFERYVTGIVSDLLGSDIQSDVTCARKPLRQLQSIELTGLLQKSIELVNSKVERMTKFQLKDLVGQVQRVKSENNMSIGLNGLLQEFLKTINLALADILTLVSGGSDLLWKLYPQSDSQELKRFCNSLINLGLISATFSLMSSRFEDIVLLVGYTQHIIDNFLTKIILHAPDAMTHMLLSVILDSLNKEIGFSSKQTNIETEQEICTDDKAETKSESGGTSKIIETPREINGRIFLRMFDPIGQLRTAFLLNHIYLLLSKRISKPESKTSSVLSILSNLTETLLFCAYHSETPIQVRLFLRCLKYLSDFLRDEVESNNTSIFESRFFYYEVEGLQEIISQCSKELVINQALSLVSKPNLKKKYLEFSRPQSATFPLKGLRLLFEKIGTYILNEQLEQNSSNSNTSQVSCRQALTTLLNKAQFQSQYKNRISSLYMSFSSDSSKKKDKHHVSSIQQSQQQPTNMFIVLGQLSEEEDLTFLLKVLYYWEELYPTQTSIGMPKNVEEYLEQKKNHELKKEAIAKSNAAAAAQATQGEKVDNGDGNSDQSSRIHKLMERIFTSLPEINGVSEKEEDLPVGWQFNYIGLFNDFSVFHLDTKRGKIKKKVKQVWQNASLTALIQKMDKADKEIKEFEETDTLEVKMEIIQAKNFINRIQSHLKDIQTIASLFNIFGYGPMFDFLPQDKAEELSSLVNYGIKNQLKNIPLDGVKESYRKLLDPNEVSSPKAEKKTVVQKDNENDKQSRMVVQICHASLFPLYEIGIDLVTSLSSKESFFADANATSIIQTHCKGGQSANNIVSDTIEFFRHICSDSKLLEIQKASLKLCLDTLIQKNWETEISQIDRSYIAGVLNTVGGWPQSVRQTAKGILNNVDYEQGMECILSGGVGSGSAKCNIVSTNSANTAVQTVLQKKITPIYSSKWASNEFPCFGELFKAIQKCAEILNRPNEDSQENKKQEEKKEIEGKQAEVQKSTDIQISKEKEKEESQKQGQAEEIKEDNPKDDSTVIASNEISAEDKKTEESIVEEKIPKVEPIISLNQEVKDDDQKAIETKKYQELQWKIRGGLLMRFLLQIATTLEWNKAVEQGLISKSEGLILLEIIKSLCRKGQEEKLSWSASEEEFVSAWEEYLDKSEGVLERMRFPKQFNSKKNHSKFLKEEGRAFPSLRKLTSSQGAAASGELGDFVPSASAYAASLPQEQPEVAENKLLKYWEKFVIPKIYDFVKSTLKPYELEDFFEQIRFPLRKGEQAAAMKVAYIICEKNLPAGVVLPDGNHDWNTIAIEEVRVGQWLIASISSNKSGQLFSPFFSREKSLQGTQVPVLAIGADARNSAVLCLYRDYDRAHVISLWLPVTCLKMPEQPIRPPASSYANSHIAECFFSAMVRSITVLSRQVLLQFFSLDEQKVSLPTRPSETSLAKQNNLISDLQLSFLDILRSSVVEEVLDDPIFGWIKTNGSVVFLTEEISKALKSQTEPFSCVPQPEEDQFTLLRSHIKQDLAGDSEHQAHLVPFKKLRQIQHFIDWAALRKKPVVSEIFEYIANKFKPLVSLTNKYVSEINIVSQAQINSPDGQVQNSNSSKPFRLCQFEGEEANQIGAIVLAFHKDAILGIYSGIKFFEDELGINKTSQLNAGKQQKKLIEPMMFRGRDVFCSYYFNKHQLSPFEADEVQSQLPCVIYGIPKDWNMICWLIDSLSSSLMKTKEDKESLDKLGKIMGILTESFDQLKGPSIIKQLLAKLITRTARKLRFLVRSQIYCGALKISPGEEVAMHWKVIGVRSEFLRQQVTKAKEIRSYFKQELSLHSSFTQDYMEMICTLAIPLTFGQTDKATFNPRELFGSESQNFPRWLEYGVNLLLLMNFFENEGLLSKELSTSLLKQQHDFQGLQQNNFVLFENLPSEWSPAEIRQIVLNMAQKSKLRILSPQIDVQILEQSEALPTKTAFVFVDGAAALDLEEVALEKKREEEEKAKLEAQQQIDAGVEASAPVVPAHPEVWICETCTLQNLWDLPACEVCETPKPENIPLINDNDDKENGDDKGLAAEEETLKIEDQIQAEQKEESDRVLKLIENMKQSVSDFYLSKKEKAQKEILEIDAQKIEIEKKSEIEIVKLLEEITKKEAKEKKKLDKLKLEEAKRQKKSASKKGGNKTTSQVSKIPSEDGKVQDVQQGETLEQLQEQLKQLKSKLADVVASLEDRKNKLTQEITELDEFIKNSCQSIQGFESISTNDRFKAPFDQFIRSRFLQGDTQKIKLPLLRKIEKRCKGLSSAVLSSIVEKLNLKDSDGPENLVKTIESLMATEGQSEQVISIINALGMDLQLDVVVHVHGEKVAVLPASQISQLLKFIEREVCKETKIVLKYNATSIRFHKSSFAFSTEDSPLGYSSDAATLPYMRLTEYPLSEIRLSWALLKLMNKILEANVQLINMSSKEEALDHLTQAQKNMNGFILPLSLSDQLSTHRSFWMSPIKIELAQRVFNMTSVKRDSVPKVQVERLRIQKPNDMNSNEFPEVVPVQTIGTKSLRSIVTSAQKENFLFTKAFDQIKDLPVTLLRPPKPTGTDPFIAFETIFKGELVMGEAGPYRQFFADISSELQANVLSAIDKKQLNLLLPSTNNLSKIGDARDKYVVNPSAKSSYQLQLFEFLGILMGTCIRTGTHLTLDLPRILWKQLVGEEIAIEDLEEIDRPVFDMIKFIETCEKSVFQESFFETYTVALSDLSTIELKKNGSKTNVLFEDRQDYIARVVDAKVRESSLQVQAIKSGLNQIIPAALLSSVLASDLEMWVCGRKKVDFDLLKRHTIYSAGVKEDSPHIIFLWSVLHELQHSDSLRFIKFCWGQERLPANDEEFERNQIRFMIKPISYTAPNPDKALPKADTCFFNLELPFYTSKAILRAQLLLAINTDCDSMNAEDPIALDPDQGYTGDNGNYSSDDDDDDDHNPDADGSGNEQGGGG